MQFVLDDAPRVTRTMAGLRGDPVNVGLIGTKEEIVAAMFAAKWWPAAPITVKNSLKLARSVVMHRPDETAPVSNLYFLVSGWEGNASAGRKHLFLREILG